MRDFLFFLLLSSLFLLFAWHPRAGASEENPHYVQQGNTAMMGAAVGHHQTWGLSFPAFFPMLELRVGYNPLENLQFRIDLGGGACYVSQSEQESFEGATLLILNAQLGIYWTPRIGDSLTFRAGPTIAWWMTSLFGDDLLNASYGEKQDYLEDDVQAFGGLVGLDIDLGEQWALSVEARYNTASASLGGIGVDSGGLTLLVGFVYRTAPWDLEQPE